LWSVVPLLIATGGLAGVWLLLRVQHFQAATLAFTDTTSLDLWHTLRGRGVALVSASALDSRVRQVVADRIRRAFHSEGPCAFLHVSRKPGVRTPAVWVGADGDDYLIEIICSRCLARVLLAAIAYVRPRAVYVSLDRQAVGGPWRWLQYAITLDGETGFVLRNVAGHPRLRQAGVIPRLYVFGEYRSERE
jgi:hypothetical protein